MARSSPPSAGRPANNNDRQPTTVGDRKLGRRRMSRRNYCITLIAHSRGDFPRQGDDRHRHTMSVRRGPDGDGIAALKCSTCHQDHNPEGRHTPPGAPDWHLPPAATPMIWEGLTDGRLCELFKDPQQNGGRDVDGIVEHMNTPLVLWGWNPGDGRTPVPIPQATFLVNVRQWAAKGAACPSGPSAPQR